MRITCLKRNKGNVYLFTCFHLNSLLEKMAYREENNVTNEEKVRIFLNVISYMLQNSGCYILREKLTLEKTSVVKKN